MWKLSIDMAERNGSALRRLLASAERLSDAAIARAERRLKTPGSRSSALLLASTRADQRRVAALPAAPELLRRVFFFAAIRVRFAY